MEDCSEEPVVQKFETPQKVYPVTRKNGKIDVELTPTIKRVRNCIYVFKNIRTDERLIGRTGMLLKDRVSAYKYAMNMNQTDQKTSSFIKSIRENPEDFTFGILAISNTPSNLDDLEREYIEGKGSQENGYNCNRGGGGGSVCI